MKSIRVVVMGAILAVSSLLGVVTFSAPASAEARECGDNAIIRCGAMSASELKSEYDKNDRGLKKIYSYYNIDASDIASASSAKTGYAHTDGTVTVDGEVVATGAQTVGRSGSLGGKKVDANGWTVYQGPDRLKSKLSAYVFFNADGTFKSAVLKVCGNPVKATPKPKPVYKCNALNAAQVTRTKFQFTTDATATNGATIKDYTYNFGDGQTATAGASTSHEYVKEGTYKVSVGVRVNVNGQVVTAPGTCVAEVTVKPADAPGITIQKTVNDAEHANVAVGEVFTYKIVVTNTGNIALKDAMITDTAPNEVTLIAASAGTVSGQKWTYTVPNLAVKESMTFTITAKYATYASGTHKNTVCVDTPTLPDTSPDACDDAATDTTTPDTPTPVTPELPHTGIADVLGGGLGLSGLAGATYYYISSRRSLR